MADKFHKYFIVGTLTKLHGVHVSFPTLYIKYETNISEY